MIIQSNRNLPVKNQHPFRSPEGKGLLDIKDRFEPAHSSTISEDSVFTMKEKYNMGLDANKVCEKVYKKEPTAGDMTGFITGGIAAVFGLLTLGAAIAMALAMFVGAGCVIALGL